MNEMNIFEKLNFARQDEKNFCEKIGCVKVKSENDTLFIPYTYILCLDNREFAYVNLTLATGRYRNSLISTLKDIAKYEEDYGLRDLTKTDIADIVNKFSFNYKFIKISDKEHMLYIYNKRYELVFNKDKENMLFL